MVVECEVGPCMLGGIAAEGQAQKKKVLHKKNSEKSCDHAMLGTGTG